MAYSLYDAHTEPLFRKLDILTLRKLVIHRIALLMFKFNIGILPQPNYATFYSTTLMYITRTPEQKTLYMFKWGDQKGLMPMLASIVYTFGIYFPSMFRQIFLMQASNMYQIYKYIHMIYSIDIGHKFTLYMYFTSRSIHDSITYIS